MRQVGAVGISASLEQRGVWTDPAATLLAGSVTNNTELVVGVTEVTRPTKPPATSTALSGTTPS